MFFLLGTQEYTECRSNIFLAQIYSLFYDVSLTEGDQILLVTIPWTFKHNIDLQRVSSEKCFILNTEQSIPRANTVLFYSDRDFSTLTWSYAEPRVLTNIHINPIPFDYPTDPSATFHSLDIEVIIFSYFYFLSLYKREFVRYLNVNTQVGVLPHVSSVPA